MQWSLGLAVVSLLTMMEFYSMDAAPLFLAAAVCSILFVWHRSASVPAAGNPS
jgi:hypothetical protein